MSMPGNKSDGPMVGGKLNHEGKISSKMYDEKWVNPKTDMGQPSCREEIKGKMKREERYK
jgi:hypothetical protein